MIQIWQRVRQSRIVSQLSRVCFQNASTVAGCSLQNNQITSGAAKLADALATNRTLTSLDLDGNDVSFFTQRTIDSRIRANARSAQYNAQLLGDSIQPSQLKVNAV